MVAPVLLLARVAANDDDAAITQSSTLSDPAGSGVVAAPSQPKGCAFFVHIIVALLALRVARPPGAARSAPRPPPPPAMRARRPAWMHDADQQYAQRASCNCDRTRQSADHSCFDCTVDLGEIRRAYLWSMGDV